MKKKDEFTEALEANKPNNIYYKLSLVKQEIGVLSKNAKNPFFKSDYLDLNGILSAVEPLLHKYGLLLLQPVIDGAVVTEIVDVETGQKVVSSMQLPNIADPQKVLACTTYFRRGGLQCLLSLQAVDDDGNHASKPEPKKLDDKRFNDALQAINDGKIDRDYVSANFELSLEQLAELENY